MRSEFFGSQSVCVFSLCRVSLTSEDGASREWEMKNLKWIWSGYGTFERRDEIAVGRYKYTN